MPKLAVRHSHAKAVVLDAWLLSQEAGLGLKVSDAARTTQLKGGSVLKELCPRCHLCTWSKAETIS